MGKVREPQRISVPIEWVDDPIILKWAEQGHIIQPYIANVTDLFLGPRCQWTDKARLPYVDRKLKEIVKEVAK